MNAYLIFLILKRAGFFLNTNSQDQIAPLKENTALIDNLTKGQVTAFPDSPKAPPPHVKDLQVPPAPVTPGPLGKPEFATSVPLTASEAARIALLRQPSLGTSIGTIQMQQGHTLQTGAVEHPQLYIGAGYDWIQSLSHVSPGEIVQVPADTIPAGVSPVSPFSLSANVSQLIFDFNMTRNLVRQSEALERSDEQSLTAAQLQVVSNVVIAFYNYADAVRLVAVNEANVVNRQRQLDLALARLKNGVGEPSDVATAESSKSQGILTLNVARDTAEQDRIALLQDMGVDPLTPVLPSIDPAPPTRERDAHALTDTAIKLRPEVRSAVEAVAAARYGLSAARATNLPGIYAEIGAGSTGSGLPPDDNVANVSVGFRFPLLDGGYRKGAVRTAQGQLTTADATLKTAVLQVRTDVATAYMALLSAEQRVGITDNEVANAREDVRIAEGRYAAGVGLFQDITTAQSLLVTSLNDQETARNALDLARTRLRRTTGELLTDVSPGALKDGTAMPGRRSKGL